MFAIGSGPVRGFAITLGLGILTSMFTAVYVTRLIIETWMRWKKPKVITLSRTLMTASTTLIALIVLLVFGGDVIRGFVFAMVLGVILGTWSTLYVAKNIVLFLGIDRSEKTKRGADHEFANIDA